MSESFHVNRDDHGDMTIDADTWTPEPELVVAVARNGEFAFVSVDDEFWTDQRVAAAMVELTNKMLDRIRSEG